MNADSNFIGASGLSSARVVHGYCGESSEQSVRHSFVFPALIIVIPIRVYLWLPCLVGTSIPRVAQVAEREGTGRQVDAELRFTRDDLGPLARLVDPLHALARRAPPAA